jgi:hypothetical protein
MDSHFDGSERSVAENHGYRRNGKEYVKGGRCTYIFLHNTLYRLLTGTM